MSTFAATPDLAAAPTPLISVIVRSMDRPSLAQALDSVAAQNWPAVEVVVVNARGPEHRPLPDRCGAFDVIAANAGGGTLPRAQAANCGLDTAKGTWLLFLDDDDLLLPDHLARLAAALQSAPLAPAAFADVEMGREQGGAWQPLHVFDAGFDATRLWFENYLPIHAVLFRHPGPALRFDASFELFEDWDFWLQMAARGDFVHVPGVSARYRLSETGVLGIGVSEIGDREIGISEIGQSNVFADSPQANAARSALFAKWQPRISPAQHAGVLTRLQAVTREAADQRAQRALAATTEANLKAIVGAREAEIAEAGQLRRGLASILGERERELVNAHTHSAELQQIVTSRTHDAVAAAAHAEALEATVAARERELADARAHADGLNAIIAAREHDNAQAVAHAAGLAEIIAARDAEITGLRDELTHAQQSLQQLIHERPLQALQRTLKKQHDSGPG